MSPSRFSTTKRNTKLRPAGAGLTWVTSTGESPAHHHNSAHLPNLSSKSLRLRNSPPPHPPLPRTPRQTPTLAAPDLAVHRHGRPAPDLIPADLCDQVNVSLADSTFTVSLVTKISLCDSNYLAPVCARRPWQGFFRCHKRLCPRRSYKAQLELWLRLDQRQGAISMP